MGEDKKGGEDITISKDGVSLPVGFLTRTFFPERVARAETIQALAASAARKIAEGVDPSQEERDVHEYVMAPVFRKAERTARIVKRAEEIVATKTPPLLTTGETTESSPPAENCRADEQWGERFLDYTGYVADADGEELWARVLARQAQRPGSFSLKTLSVLRDVSSESARLFTKLLEVSTGTWVPHWSDFRREYEANGITYTTFLALDELGLVNLHPSAFGVPTAEVPGVEGAFFEYANALFKIPAGRTFGVQTLTIAGVEVAKIADVAPRTTQKLRELGNWAQREIGTGTKLLCTVRHPVSDLRNDERVWDPDSVEIRDGVVRWSTTRPDRAT